VMRRIVVMVSLTHIFRILHERDLTLDIAIKAALEARGRMYDV
jgi:hypothetical protein